MKSQSFWCQDERLGLIHDEDLSPLSDGMCLVRTLYSAISPGTERTVFCGQVPEMLREEMRCPYMEGDFSFPVKYGYSVVGEVIEGPPDFLGKLVHVLHPHQTVCPVRCEDLLVLPQDLPPARATLISNLETAVTALWDSDIHLGDRAMVSGMGVIGSLVARLLSGMPGIDLRVTDTSPLKLSWAEEMGFTLLGGNDQPEEFDLAFNASASSEGLQKAIDSVGMEGKVIELSWYGTQNVSLWLGDTFHSHRKSIVCSQVSSMPAVMRSRWDAKRRRSLCARLLKDPAFDQHIRHTVRFADLPAFFRQLVEAPSNYLSVLVDYS